MHILYNLYIHTLCNLTGYNKNGLVINQIMKVFKTCLCLFVWDLIYFPYVCRNNFCTTTHSPIFTKDTHNILKIMVLNEVKSGTHMVLLHRS